VERAAWPGEMLWGDGVGSKPKVSFEYEDIRGTGSTRGEEVLIGGY
jgi:hypothetical protein